MITRFECPNLRTLLLLRVLHARVAWDVRRRATGFITVRALVDRRARVLLSVSIWEDLHGVYSMGNVSRHIIAARLPGRLGVRTTSGVFCSVGDWRRVMFRSPVSSNSPLRPLPTPTD